MATTSAAIAQQSSFINQILHGDCIEVMRQMPANSVDFILSDPPYLVNYRDRDGRSIQNDADDTWLKPAMAEAYRVLKHGSRRRDVLRMDEGRCVLRKRGRSAGFPACRTHCVSQGL